MTRIQHAEQLFGTNIIAMVTPMQYDGSLDPAGIAGVVDYVLGRDCDGLVVGGTTGESATLSDAEASHLLHTVADRAGDRARIIAGIATADTEQGVIRARKAEAAGAHALLVSAPYYVRPTQAGVIAHCIAIANSVDLPVMLYDVPARAGIEFEPATLAELAEHPGIYAVKDAKGNLAEASDIMARTSLAYYCGIDDLNLPYLACGATGLVSVVGNAAPDRTGALIRAIRDGDLHTARTVHASLLPLTHAIMDSAQGAVMAKASLVELGVILDAAVRLPLLECPAADLLRLRAVLVDSAMASTIDCAADTFAAAQPTG